MGPKYEKYRPLLSNLDLSEEQKDDLLRTMWSITQSCIDRSFGEDPVQQVSCKQEFDKQAHGKATENLGVDDSNKVKSSLENKKKDYKELEP